MREYHREEEVSITHLDSLYDEMREIRDHLLTRIEMLEDDVVYLENNIDRLKTILKRNNPNERQESSKVDY